MKRIRVILQTIDDQEFLKVEAPLFVAIVADRFVIEDRRTKLAERSSQKEEK